jgi:hypothetical protein
MQPLNAIRPAHESVQTAMSGFAYEEEDAGAVQRDLIGEALPLLDDHGARCDQYKEDYLHARVSLHPACQIRRT